MDYLEQAPLDYNEVCIEEQASAAARHAQQTNKSIKLYWRYVRFPLKLNAIWMDYTFEDLVCAHLKPKKDGAFLVKTRC